MNKLLILILVSLNFTNCFSQKKTTVNEKVTVTDSCNVSGYKFILTETNGIAQLKAFSNNKELPVLKTIKMSGPVFFVRKNGTEKILKDDVSIDNGDTVTVFLLLGNEAPQCSKEGRNLKFKEDFCGMNVQGVVISPKGITLTDFMYNGFTCVKENPLENKDLFTFANSGI